MFVLKVVTLLSLSLFCYGTIDEELMEIIRKMEQVEQIEVEESEIDRAESLTRWISGFKGFDPEEFVTFIIDPTDDIVSTLVQ